MSSKALLVAAIAAILGSSVAAHAADDSFAVGSVWKGTLKQKGTFMKRALDLDELDCELKVTAREKNNFTADFSQKGMRKVDDLKDVAVVYKVKGKVIEKKSDENSAKLEFEAVAAEKMKNVPNASACVTTKYKATLDAELVDGKWELRDEDSDTDMHGTFRLELQAPDPKQKD